MPDEEVLPATLFRWDTFKEVHPHDLRRQGHLVSGRTCEVALVGGKVIQVWRSQPAREYFCHGLTFGGKEAPGGPISPYTGAPVETILREHYRLIDETQCLAGDTVVWYGSPPESTPHSAVVTVVRLVPGKNYLDEAGTKLRTKNGLSPEAEMTLQQLIDLYGESYNAYRRK